VKAAVGGRTRPQAACGSGAPGGTIYPSQLYDAIDAVAELDYWTMTVPAAPIEMSASALPTMGTLTVI
jgi:uncharacterized phage protein gp47/JayE